MSCMTPECLSSYFFEGEELKNVREKNGEYESAEQRLSSEKVRQPEAAMLIIPLFSLLSEMCLLDCWLTVVLYILQPVRAFIIALSIRFIDSL